MKNRKTYTKDQLEAVTEAANLLVDALDNALVTRAEVAAACGTSQSTVCRWAHRQLLPHIDVAPKITGLIRSKLGQPDDAPAETPVTAQEPQLSEEIRAMIRAEVNRSVTDALVEAAVKVVDLAKHNQEWQDRITTQINKLTHAQTSLDARIAGATSGDTLAQLRAHGDRIKQLEAQQERLMAYSRQLGKRSFADRLAGRMPEI